MEALAKNDEVNVLIYSASHDVHINEKTKSIKARLQKKSRDQVHLKVLLSELNSLKNANIVVWNDTSNVLAVPPRFKGHMV